MNYVTNTTGTFLRLYVQKIDAATCGGKSLGHKSLLPSHASPGHLPPSHLLQLSLRSHYMHA